MKKKFWRGRVAGRAGAVRREDRRPARRLRRLRLGVLRAGGGAPGEAGSLPRNDAAARRPRPGDRSASCPSTPRLPGYRLRARLHVDRRPARRIGYFAPETHRLVPATACEAIAPRRGRCFPSIEAALRESGVEASEIALLEDVDGSSARVPRDASRAPPARRRGGSRRTRSAGFCGRAAFSVPAGASAPRDGATRRSTLRSEAGRSASRSTPSSRGTATWSAPLYAAVAAEARRARADGLALDAFGGVGLFAGRASRCRPPRRLRGGGCRRGIGRRGHARALGGRRPLRDSSGSPSTEFLRRDERRFTCVVADPPRAGLGRELARELAERTERGLRLRLVRPGDARPRSAGHPGGGLHDPRRHALRPLRVHAPRRGRRLARARGVIRPVLAGGRAPAATAAIALVGGMLAGAFLDGRRARRGRAGVWSPPRRWRWRLRPSAGAERRHSGSPSRPSGPAPGFSPGASDRAAGAPRPLERFAGLPPSATRRAVVEGTLADFWSGRPPRARTTLAAERVRDGPSWREFPAEVTLFVSGETPVASSRTEETGSA